MATEQLEALGSEDAKWLGEYSQVHMNVFGTPLRVMDHGEGARIWDVDGNEYLDFLAGIAVNALGYAHPKWVKAVSEQAAKAAHVSNYFANRRSGLRPSSLSWPEPRMAPTCTSEIPEPKAMRRL